MKKFSLFVVFLFTILSCGSDTGGVINNAGTGSQTLKVDVSISAKEKFSGAKNIEDFTTDMGYSAATGYRCINNCNYRWQRSYNST